jgi:hypothetical protein
VTTIRRHPISHPRIGPIHQEEPLIGTIQCAARTRTRDLRAALAGATAADPRARLRECGHAYRRFAQSHPQVYRMMATLDADLLASTRRARLRRACDRR